MFADKIKITFLGTGTSQGVPVIACNCEVCTSSNPYDKRLRTSILVESSTTTIVIDAGPDFRQQLLKNKVSKLDAVVFTHEHKDHISGLDDVRAFNYVQKKAIPVYATERVVTALKREYAYIFDNNQYPGIPQIEVLNFENEKFNIGDIEIQPIEVLHYKLPVKGFKINNFVYITDANYIDAENKKIIKNADVLVLNALRHEAHISHFTFKEALNLAEELNSKKTYLTHISHQLGTFDSLQNSLPKNVELAVDDMQIII
jgi:phosphoribosyl 1,2-cyclic phosphate phosphodiesterase